MSHPWLGAATSLVPCPSQSRCAAVAPVGPAVTPQGGWWQWGRHLRGSPFCIWGLSTLGSCNKCLELWHGRDLGQRVRVPKPTAGVLGRIPAFLIPSVQLGTAHRPKAPRSASPRGGISSPKPPKQSERFRRAGWQKRWGPRGEEPPTPKKHRCHFSHHSDPSSKSKGERKLQGHRLGQDKKKVIIIINPSLPPQIMPKIKN